MANIQNLTNIDGAVLTQDAIEALKSLQDDDNDFLNSQICSISDAICYVARTALETTAEQKMKEILHDLSIIKETLESFKKP